MSNRSNLLLPAQITAVARFFITDSEILMNGLVDMKIIAALCSAVLWGSGQVINKQKLKGFVFFSLQGLLVFIELSTGSLDVLTGKAEVAFRNCGFFTKGFWGLVTLGEIPRATSSVLVYDHSVMLLITGVVSIVILLGFALVWIWNIRDAYSTRAQIEQGDRIGSIAYAKKLWQDSFEYIMVAPGAVAVLFIVAIPVICSFLIAFTNYSSTVLPPMKTVDWVGIKTFIDIVKIPMWSKTFLNVLSWNVVWAVGSTFLAYLLGMLVANLINAKGIRFKGFWRGLYILPWAVPALVSLLAFKFLFNGEGAINQMLLNSGIINQAVPFLTSTGWARTVVLLVSTWLGFPYFMALISGVMTAISPEQYEAVEIDGGNGWHKFRYISLPTIITATAPQITMTLIGNFNNFGMVYFITEGGPLNPSYQFAGTTDILISWIFKLTQDQQMYNVAAVISILIFIFTSIFGVLNLMKARVYKEDL